MGLLNATPEGVMLLRRSDETAVLEFSQQKLPLLLSVGEWQVICIHRPRYLEISKVKLDEICPLCSGISS